MVVFRLKIQSNSTAVMRNHIKGVISMPSNKNNSLYVFKSYVNLPDTSFGHMDKDGNWIFTGVVYLGKATDETPYSAVTITHREHACFNAALDLSTGIYKLFEVGFSSKFSLEELLKGPKQRENAARVDGSHYNGAYREYIQGQREGIWTLTWNNGTFLYEKLQNDSEPQEGEPESVTKKRRSYWKQVYMDMILNGDPIKIVYNWKDDASMKYIVERERLFNIPDLAVRRDACSVGLAGYLDAKAGHMIDRKIENGEDVLMDKGGKPVDSVQEFITRKPVLIAKMVGKKFQVYRWYSPSKIVDITEENLNHEVGIILAGKGSITVKEIK